MESIEVVVRQSLNTTAVKQNTPDTNVKAEILETTLNCVQHWDTIRVFQQSTSSTAWSCSKLL